MTQFKIPKFCEKSAKVRHSNDSGVMLASQIALSEKTYSHLDPLCTPWAEMLSVTDRLPAKTWIRVMTNLQSHFPNPYDANPIQADRVTQGLIGRLMYRNSNPNDALNLLFVTAPGINAHSGTSDAWTKITVDPLGAKLAAPLQTKLPRDRDWWRPEPSILPYIKQSFQKYVNMVNDSAAEQARAKYGESGKSLNFVQKIAFQVGNEPGTGHPGGSMYAQIGSWAGLGEVTDGYSVGVNYGVSPAVRANLQIPAHFGTNPLTMPAFSFLNENANQIMPNYVGGRLMNFQQSGAFAPGVNELATYGKEMFGYKWSQQCGRRAMHFRSPVLRWRFFKNDFGHVSAGGKELLHYGPQDPTYGRWETPQEYAKRWVEDLERGVELIASLPMPSASKVVDITECYFINGDLGGASFDAGMTDSSGAKINFATKTLEEVRAASKSCRASQGKFLPLLPTQVPASRKDYMIAIRNELFQRDVVQKNLSKNLGRIFIWSSLSSDPRFHTGLNAANDGNVVGYNPWNDFRLTTDEMLAFWNLK